MKTDRAIRFLVIDDLELMRKTIMSCLEQMGFRNITLASDGRQSLELLEDQPFDCIISDWIMPHLSGLELLRHVRSVPKLQSIKFMLVTASGDSVSVNEAIDEGVDQFLVKPFNLGNLERKINSLLKKPSFLPKKWQVEGREKRVVKAKDGETGSPAQKPMILVVDDISSNIDLLVGALKDDYQIRAARSGEAAIKICQNTPELDLILLDVMMPEMDGFSVCEQLKTNPTTERIPVIFLTSKNDTVDITHGFSLGAVDYISKPVKSEILKARVAAHIQIKRSRDELEEKIDTIMENARLREDIERLTRHDLKSPLGAIIGTTEVLLKNEKLGFGSKELIQEIRASSFDILTMINRSLDIYKMETGHYELTPEEFDIVETLKEAVDDARILGRDEQIKVLFSPPEEPLMIRGEKLLCFTILGNLLKNAVEASKEEESIMVAISFTESAIITIHNNAPIPAEIQDSLFEKHVTFGKKGGTGLGTYSAKLLATIQQGDVTFESSEAFGTTFTVSLPTV